MEYQKVLPVILSGGVGSRLWPLSRELHPKPFIKVEDGKSLIQKTYERVAGFEGVKEVVTVTNRDLFFYTKDEFDDLPANLNNTFLLEPVGRDSTAAIALAAEYAAKEYGSDCTLLILPADHLIGNLGAFYDAVKSAMQLASNDRLVTFGIRPDGPKTGFGYIEASGNEVVRFVEKPNQQVAQQYYDSGNFLWNSGMFCMRAGVFLQELKSLCPDVSEGVSDSFETANLLEGSGWRQYELSRSSFSRVRAVSVDYAVFEKSNKVSVIPCDIGWSDIGSWTELGVLSAPDDLNNNALGDVILEDTKDCIIHGSDKTIATLGVENLIVADTSDALLVAHKDRAQDVKKIVNRLKSNDSPSYKGFPTVHRPWGAYTVLQEGLGFKLKRIEVKPGASLSLQSHKHRSEHWVVVRGKALVTNGDELIELTSNQSTYIPIGNVHRLQNKGGEQLIIIEVQCGDYLGEDDIVRYDDVYGRVA